MSRTRGSSQGISPGLWVTLGRGPPCQLFLEEMGQWRAMEGCPLPQDHRHLSGNLSAHNQQDAISFPKGEGFTPFSPHATGGLAGDAAGSGALLALPTPHPPRQAQKC